MFSFLFRCSCRREMFSSFSSDVILEERCSVIVFMISFRRDIHFLFSKLGEKLCSYCRCCWKMAQLSSTAGGSDSKSSSKFTRRNRICQHHRKHDKLAEKGFAKVKRRTMIYYLIQPKSQQKDNFL